MAAALGPVARLRGDGRSVAPEVLLPRDVRVSVRARARRATSATTSSATCMARTKRMRGYNVLHPFGWDAFGLPAENAAIKNGIHPEESTRANIAHMKGQLQRLGISYAWEREFATCDAEYYKWNQWLFIRMFERGLAYRRTLVGELVSEGSDRPRQRAGRRWRLLALRHSGRNARPRAVVLPHHRLRRRTARRDGRADAMARKGADDAAELDRAVGRRAREVRAGG